ncbi:Uncharacterized protein EbC_pEb17200770 (plasmid) [Erwinia billingiae Eb661]|uniref:Uncharacterized protein n=1 Tax=Erwinia billingiae (strain Eb661) TaxID=634500 RepID=D8MJT2_ERWBE|nr:Uncharacterized protein EbC_pEb17200770 [Erwinia billingiae Eb661]
MCRYQGQNTPFGNLLQYVFSNHKFKIISAPVTKLPPIGAH